MGKNERTVWNTNILYVSLKFKISNCQYDIDLDLKASCKLWVLQTNSTVTEIISSKCEVFIGN